jgi:hypothetical protein
MSNTLTFIFFLKLFTTKFTGHPKPLTSQNRVYLFGI